MAKALGLDCSTNEPNEQQQLSRAAPVDETGAGASLEAATAAADAAARASRRRGLEAAEVRTWERDAKFRRLQEEARRHMQRALLGDSSAGAVPDDNDASPPDAEQLHAVAGTWDANTLAAYSAQLSTNASTLSVCLLDKHLRLYP